MTIRLGIIGAGVVVGKHYLPNLTARTDCAVTAICSGHGDSARALAGQYRIPAVPADWRELLALPTVDAVLICTPNCLHYELARAALAAGKHVLLEKPVCSTLADTRALLAAAAASDRTFAITFNQGFREENAWLYDQAMAPGGGPPTMISLQWVRPSQPGEDRNWRRRHSQAGGGVLMDLGPHVLHLALSLLPARRRFVAQCRLGRHEGPDAVDHTACGLLTVDDATLVSFWLSWALPEKCSPRVCYEVFGPHGSFRNQDYTGPHSTGWQHFFDMFFAHIRAGTKPDLAIAGDVMMLLDVCYRAAATGVDQAGVFGG